MTLYCTFQLINYQASDIRKLLFCQQLNAILFINKIFIFCQHICCTVQVHQIVFVFYVQTELAYQRTVRNSIRISDGQQ